MERRQGGVPFGGAVFQTGYFSPHPPALKGGVTANVALQAGRGFATAAFVFASCVPRRFVWRGKDKNLRDDLPKAVWCAML